jgi:hypothetical protein
MTKEVKIETDEYENHLQTKKVSWAYSPNEQLNKHACAEIQSIQAIVEQKKEQKNGKSIKFTFCILLRPYPL